MQNTKKIWFITGVSSGLGRSLAQKAIQQGDFVAGTVRSPEKLAEFNRLSPETAVAFQADVTENTSIRNAVQAASDRFGRIDVLANNAGYGLVGSIEETTDAEAHEIFEANFFGQLNTIRAVLPSMRKQKSGHILNYSAVGGFTGFAGLGVYSAAKAAIDVLGEALAQELKPFGIDVTILTIGIFRTNFASGSLQHTASVMPEYAETSAGKFRGFIGQLAGKQPNDPDRAANAIFQLVRAPNPPLHLALGQDAIGVMRTKIESVSKDLSQWEPVSASTTYAQDQAASGR